jgi:hypothetical protein
MRPIHRLLAGLGIAVAGLVFYDRQANTETFTLDTSYQSPLETWKGVAFNAGMVSTIKALITHHVPAPASAGCEPSVILWLGNSQLHLINQYRRGDHLAPYWLRSDLSCPDQTVPMGVSLANANLQELYVLSAAASRLRPRAILLELCFDDLREDGLRAEFSGFIDSAARKRLTGNAVGREIVAQADAGWSKSDTSEENGGLWGFAQKSVEDRLDGALSVAWPLWNDRSNLRIQVMTQLYFLRNRVLAIKSTTVRKMIAPRYARNMQALEQLLLDARQDGVAVVAYVAPIRQGVPLPYDAQEYWRWKIAVSDMARRHGAVFQNLEALVPAAVWGTYSTDDIDFMHFRGEGHKILAHALLPHVEGVK